LGQIVNSRKTDQQITSKEWGKLSIASVTQKCGSHKRHVPSLEHQIFRPLLERIRILFLRAKSAHNRNQTLSRDFGLSDWLAIGDSGVHYLE
jgi:hypothetical protein